MAAKFLADQNFNNRLLRAVLDRVPGCDVTRTQDQGLESMPDELLLGWAADHQRVLLTHDSAILVGLAWERVKRSQPMSGVIVIHALDRSAAAVDDLAYVVGCGNPDDFRNLVMNLPF